MIGGTMHVRRGGSFVNTSQFARSADRAAGTAEFRSNSVGVRPARAVVTP